jgi:hypothetical protein
MQRMPRHLLGVADAAGEIRHPGWDLNRSPPTYKSEAFPLKVGVHKSQAPGRRGE